MTDEVERPGPYAKAIMEAIKGVAPAIDQRAATDALVTVAAMTMIAGDRDWTEEGVIMLGASAGQRITSALLSMLRLRAAGNNLPFDMVQLIQWDD